MGEKPPHTYGNSSIYNIAGTNASANDIEAAAREAVLREQVSLSSFSSFVYFLALILRRKKKIRRRDCFVAVL